MTLKVAAEWDSDASFKAIIELGSGPVRFVIGHLSERLAYRPITCHISYVTYKRCTKPHNTGTRRVISCDYNTNSHSIPDLVETSACKMPCVEKYVVLKSRYCISRKCTEDDTVHLFLCLMTYALLAGYQHYSRHNYISLCYLLFYFCIVSFLCMLCRFWCLWNGDIMKSQKDNIGGGAAMNALPVRSGLDQGG